MILAALILQAAAPQSAVDAERAFNAAAQAKGQWTAFREYAAADATMFVPQPLKAQAWLKDRRDPPRSIEWWPVESWVSCDGGMAVNTGGWKLPDGTVGFFSSVWRKEADGGWKWIVDSGDALKTARERPTEPKVVRAVCERIFVPGRKIDRINRTGFGLSEDTTLGWEWAVRPDGGRMFSVRLWNGQGLAEVIHDEIAAPGK